MDKEDAMHVGECAMIWVRQASTSKQCKVQWTDAGRDWGQEEKGTTEDEMAGWHH